LIRKFAHKQEEQKDLYQDIVLGLLEKNCDRIIRWEPRAQFSSYLYLVVWRFCVQCQKSRWRQDRILDNPGPDRSGNKVSPLETLERPPSQRSNTAFSELVSQINECFEQLIESGSARDKDRPMFLLRVEGYSASFVGKIMNLTQDVVHTRFKRVRDRLRDCLRAHGFTSYSDILTDFEPPGDFTSMGKANKNE